MMMMMMMIIIINRLLQLGIYNLVGQVAHEKPYKKVSKYLFKVQIG